MRVHSSGACLAIIQISIFIREADMCMQTPFVTLGFGGLTLVCRHASSHKTEPLTQSGRVSIGNYHNSLLSVLSEASCCRPLAVLGTERH